MSFICLGIGRRFGWFEEFGRNYRTLDFTWFSSLSIIHSIKLDFLGVGFGVEITCFDRSSSLVESTISFCIFDLISLLVIVPPSRTMYVQLE